VSVAPTGRRTAAQETGFSAEARAATFLEEQGLAIVARNYRTRFGEIDLVARDGTTLVFVEVRSRTPGGFGDAASSITAAKQRRIASRSTGARPRGCRPPSTRPRVKIRS